MIIGGLHDTILADGSQKAFPFFLPCGWPCQNQQSHLTENACEQM